MAAVPHAEGSYYKVQFSVFEKAAVTRDWAVVIWPRERMEGYVGVSRQLCLPDGRVRHLGWLWGEFQPLFPWSLLWRFYTDENSITWKQGNTLPGTSLLGEVIRMSLLSANPSANHLALMGSDS